jgi:hypothetical protein
VARHRRGSGYPNERGKAGDLILTPTQQKALQGKVDKIAIQLLSIRFRDVFRLIEHPIVFLPVAGMFGVCLAVLQLAGSFIIETPFGPVSLGVITALFWNSFYSMSVLAVTQTRVKEEIRHRAMIGAVITLVLMWSATIGLYLYGGNLKRLALWCLLYIALSLFNPVLAIITGALVVAFRTLFIRIAEYNKGAWSAIIAIVTLVLGMADIYVRNKK